MTRMQRALAANRLIDRCIAESDGDMNAALSAAEILAETLSDEDLLAVTQPDRQRMLRMVENLSAALVSGDF